MLTSEEFRFGGGFVIETILSAQNAVENKATGEIDFTALNGWNFKTDGTVVDWTVKVNEESTLSSAYDLGGVELPADCETAVIADYENIYQAAAQKAIASHLLFVTPFTGYVQTEFHYHRHQLATAVVRK